MIGSVHTFCSAAIIVFVAAVHDTAVDMQTEDSQQDSQKDDDTPINVSKSSFTETAKIEQWCSPSMCDRCLQTGHKYCNAARYDSRNSQSYCRSTRNTGPHGLRGDYTNCQRLLHQASAAPGNHSGSLSIPAASEGSSGVCSFLDKFIDHIKANRACVGGATAAVGNPGKFAKVSDMAVGHKVLTKYLGAFPGFSAASQAKTYWGVLVNGAKLVQHHVCENSMTGCKHSAASIKVFMGLLGIMSMFHLVTIPFGPAATILLVKHFMANGGVDLCTKLATLGWRSVRDYVVVEVKGALEHLTHLRSFGTSIYQHIKDFSNAAMSVNIGKILKELMENIVNCVGALLTLPLEFFSEFLVDGLLATEVGKAASNVAVTGFLPPIYNTTMSNINCGSICWFKMCQLNDQSVNPHCTCQEDTSVDTFQAMTTGKSACSKYTCSHRCWNEVWRSDNKCGGGLSEYSLRSKLIDGGVDANGEECGCHEDEHGGCWAVRKNGPVILVQL